MSRRNKNSATSVILSILSVLFVALVFGVVYKFSNELNEDLKNFYVEYNGKRIVSTESRVTFDLDSDNRFDCKYNSNSDNAFNLKIVPNVNDETDFSYTVDGKNYKFSAIKDLTSCFSIDKQNNYFIISFPYDFSMQNVLDSLYSTSEVIIPENIILSQYYFTMIISDYNNKTAYNVDFNFNIKVYDISFINDGNVVKTEKVVENYRITAPNDLEKEGYTFNGWTNSAGEIVDFSVYKACENMTFTSSFSLNTVTVSFAWKLESSDSGYNPGTGSGGSSGGSSGGTESFSVNTYNAVPYWGSIDDSTTYGSFSSNTVSLTVHNLGKTVTFTIDSGYEFLSVSLVSYTSDDSGIAEYSSSPIAASVLDNTITVSLSSVPLSNSSYILYVHVKATDSGSGGGGSSGGGSSSSGGSVSF